MLGKAKIIKGIFWVGLKSIATHFMGFITFLILARLLSVEDFGKVAIVYLFTELATHVAGMGFAEGLIQRYEYKNRQFCSAICFVFFVSAVISLFLFSVGLFFHIYAYKGDLESIPLLLSFTALALLFSPSSKCFEAKYRKSLNIQKIAKYELFSIFVSAVVGVSLAFMGFGAWSLVFQTLALNIVRFFSYFFTEVRSFEFNIDKKFIKSLSRFGLPTIGSKIMQYSSNKAAHGLLAILYDVYLLGIYSTGNKLMVVFKEQFASLCGHIIFPVFSEQQTQPEQLVKSLFKTIQLSLIFSIIIFSALSVFSDSIIIILFGEKWADSAKIFSILAIAAIFNLQERIFTACLKSVGKTGLLFKVSIINLILSISILLLVINYGIVAIAYAQLLKVLLFCIILCKVTSNIIKINLQPLRLLYFKHLFFSLFLIYLVYLNLLDVDFVSFEKKLLLLFLSAFIYLVATVLSDFNLKSFVFDSLRKIRILGLR